MSTYIYMIAAPIAGLLQNIRKILAITWLHRSLSGLLFVASFSFLFRAILRLDPLGRTVLLDRAAVPQLMVLAVIQGVAILFLAAAWSAIADPHGRLSKKVLAAIYGKSVLAKYLPGGIVHYGARQWSGGAAGLDHRAMVRASAIEIGLHVACSILIMLTMFGIGYLAMPSWSLAMAALLSFVTIMAGRLSGKRPILAAACFQATFFAIFWLVTAGTAWTITADMQQAVHLATLFLAGWLIGFVIPFAPGGIGVREAAIVTLGAGQIDPATLLSFAILTRLVTLGGDLSHGLASYCALFLTALRNRQASISQ